MKSLYLLPSIGVITLLSMTALQANVIPKGAPGLPSTYAECLAKKGCSEARGGLQCLANAGVDNAWQDLCEHLKMCEDGHSGDEANWRECIDDAQGAYERATQPEAAMGIEPYQGKVLPVGTDESGSHYEQFDPEHKGYMNAQE